MVKNHDQALTTKTRNNNIFYLRCSICFIPSLFPPLYVLSPLASSILSFSVLFYCLQYTLLWCNRLSSFWSTSGLPRSYSRSTSLTTCLFFLLVLPGLFFGSLGHISMYLVGIKITIRQILMSQARRRLVSHKFLEICAHIYHSESIRVVNPYFVMRIEQSVSVKKCSTQN